MRRSPIHHAPALLIALLLVACSGGEQRIAEPSLGATQLSPTATQPSPSDTQPSPTATEASPSDAAVPSLEPSEPFGLAQVTLRSPDGVNALRVPVYVAADAAERGRGLMERDDLPMGTGMVFLFPGDTSGAFYMYNTRIPLTIVFYGADGTVVRVLDMEPCTEEIATDCELYPPGVPYRGALEVEQGYLEALDVTEGWTVELPADLPSPS